MGIKPELLRLMDTIEGLDEQANEIWTVVERLHNRIEDTKKELHKIISEIKDK